MSPDSFHYRFYSLVSRAIDRGLALFPNIGRDAKAQVLMFHHVTDEFVDTIESCKCSVSRFEQIICQLKESGYRFISMDELLCLKSGSRSSDRIAVITFDDGTEDMFLNAYPILKRMAVPFIVYVTTDFVNRDGFINDEQLDALNHEPLCSIGSHTISHPMLRYADTARDEILRSKRILEQRLGKTVDHFAYPYGKLLAVSLQNMRMAKKAGYKSAVGTLHLGVSPFILRNCTWYLPRIVLK